MFPLRQHVIFAILCGGAFLAHADSKKQTSSLAAAFESCIDMGDNPLAHGLMTTIWDPGTRATFQSKFGGLARKLQHTNFDDAGTVASIELDSPPLVAGSAPKALTALTCPEGCGLAVFTLEFGVLPPAQKVRLQAWVRQARATRWEPTGEMLKVELRTNKRGEQALVCDVSI